MQIFPRGFNCANCLTSKAEHADETLIKAPLLKTPKQTNQKKSINNLLVVCWMNSHGDTSQIHNGKTMKDINRRVETETVRSLQQECVHLCVYVCVC